MKISIRWNSFDFLIQTPLFLGIIKLYIVLEVHMTDSRFLKKAIEI